MKARPPIESEEVYCRTFTDAGFWRPFVEAVCARHDLSPVGAIRAGLAGTNPVFLVDDRWVVKFFADYFSGATSYPMEREMLRLCALDPVLPTPALIASGDLCPESVEWPWPYLVTTALPGVPYSAILDRIDEDDRLESARFVGDVLRRIHALPLDRSPLDSSWESFTAFLARQRENCVEMHRNWGMLHPRLIEEIDSYLPPIDEIIDRSVPPRPLHADLHADHLLGEFDGGRWKPAAIIDFGDAKVGDPAYEWVSLHLCLFRGDKRLLSECLDRYGSPIIVPEPFVRRAMSLTLLHECGVLAEFPAAATAGSLDELASLLWNPQTPGVENRE